MPHDATTDQATAVAERTFFGHPRGLATLFMVEMWERFSYYGMRALLVLYLVAPPDGATPPGPGLGLSTASAAGIYGAYSSLVFVTPLIGGWVADRVWGARRSFFWGGVVIACGHFLMALPLQQSFWFGLLFIAAGTGLLKPNISATVGDLYAPGDDRRDGGFSIFYMGINLGAFLSPLVTGALATNFGWHWGFLAAGIGMVAGLIQYWLGRKNLGSAGTAVPRPADARLRRRALVVATVGAVVVCALLGLDQATGGVDIENVTLAFTIIIAVIPLVYFWRIFRMTSLTDVERSRLRAFVALFIGAAIFFMIYDQAGSTLSVFAEQWTNRTVGSWEIPASWFQSINPIMVICFAPIFAWMWTKLADRAPSTPLKFAIALIGVGFSFVVMVIPGLAADHGDLSSPWWLVGVYLIQTWSELLLSPIGLSATTRLAPVALTSQLMALWFLAQAVGDAIGGQTVRLQETLGFAGYFALAGLAAVAAGIAFLPLVPWVKRQMDGA